MRSWALLYKRIPILLFAASLLVIAGCGGSAVGPDAGTALPGPAPGTTTAEASNILPLPALAPLDLGGRPLQVVATTSIIGDVVAQVGGDTIQLTTLIAPGQDPHSYEPAARDLALVEAADVIFVNGWDLEEALLTSLEQIGQEALIVPISAGIEPLPVKESDQAGKADQEVDRHHEGAADPHVWFDVDNVRQWTRNVADVLSGLDPTNAERYAANAAAYEGSLVELQAYAEAQLAQVPAEERYLVTNHSAFNYFAHAYGFTVLGTVIPAASTLAEPSANDLVQLVATMKAHDLCTVFTETTVSDTLAQTVASELDTCAEVQVVPLFVGSIGESGGYIEMFRTNVDRLVEGLT
ncbi:MAG: metal ABC transporter substrate-binding protein [Candidatus Promineifilaceae bacterium]